MTETQIILGNSNRRYSGVTSSMLATLPEVSTRMKVAIMGAHHVPAEYAVLGFREVVRLCRDGRRRVFHARRNDEMLQALLVRKLSGGNLKIVFTSTAQRHHSGLTRWLIGKMDGILSTCTAAAAYLEHSPDRIIPHGVDLVRYQPPADKGRAWQELGLPGEYGIGMFGRVRPQKGVDLLVEAAIPLLREDPGPTVVIVGETTPKYREFQESLQQKIAAAGLEDRIIFLGKRPSTELPGLFQGMSLVAALSRNEGFGLTVLEAMASGCAVLASQAGAWSDIVTEGVHGSLVPCDDPEATRAGLARLIAHPESLERMGRAGRTHAEENYSITREAEALCDYYRQQLEDDR